MVEYADRLEEAMNDAKVSVSKLAAHLKLSYQGVKKVLDGKSSAFNASNNDAAARYLDVSPSWLATGRKPKHPASASGLTAAEPLEAYALPKLSERALSLAQRFDALKNEQHARIAYATMSNVLDGFEAEQREKERQAATRKTATPAKRAARRQADPVR